MSEQSQTTPFVIFKEAGARVVVIEARVLIIFEKNTLPELVAIYYCVTQLLEYVTRQSIIALCPKI